MHGLPKVVLKKVEKILTKNNRVDWHLNVSSVMRYNEIQKAIPQATAKMLSQQLKELESDGIIRRKLYPVVPPKTEYSLTELGKPLVPIVNAMSDWGHNYFEYLGVPDPCPED